MPKLWTRIGAAQSRGIDRQSRQGRYRSAVNEDVVAVAVHEHAGAAAGTGQSANERADVDHEVAGVAAGADGGRVRRRRQDVAVETICTELVWLTAKMPSEAGARRT
jgi:hypothetical protein